MVQMQVGEKADIGCPSATAYGAKAKPKIPANSDLIFNVEVVSCEWELSSLINNWALIDGKIINRPWKIKQNLKNVMKWSIYFDNIISWKIITLWH